MLGLLKLILFFLFGVNFAGGRISSALSWNDDACTSRSLFGNLADAAFSSSGESKPNHDPSQVLSSRKGWCPSEQIDSMSHVYLEVSFGTLVNIAAVEINGVEDSSGVSYEVDKYLLDYQRDEDSNDWLRYTRSNEELLEAGRSWYDIFKPTILARRIRFIPYSNNPVDICVRFELYGCAYPDGVVSYGMPVPLAKFDDQSYDGPRRSDSLLQYGAGLLTDGILGDSSEIDTNDLNNSRSGNWVGWSAAQFSKRQIDINFKFDSVRNLTSCRIYMVTLAEARIFAASSVTFEFLVNGVVSRDNLNTVRNTQLNGDRWYDYVFARPKLAEEVYVSLSFASTNSMLLISEVRFIGVAVADSSVAKNVSTTSVPRTSANARSTGAASTAGATVSSLNATKVGADEVEEPLVRTTTRLPATRRLVTRRQRITVTTTEAPTPAAATTTESTADDWSSSSTPNSTLQLKTIQAAGSSNGLLLPIIVGVVIGFLAVCVLIATVLARKYCCTGKNYRYWAANRSLFGRKAAKSKAGLNNESSASGTTGISANGMPLLCGIAASNGKATVITNPLSISESSDKLRSLDDSQRLMLLQNGAQNTATPMFGFSSLARRSNTSTPKIGLGVGIGCNVHAQQQQQQQRFESSDYVSLPDDCHSVTTRANSIIAMPYNISSQNASVVSGDGEYRPSQSYFLQPPTHFNTANMNGMMVLLPTNQRPQVLAGLGPTDSITLRPQPSVHATQSPLYSVAMPNTMRSDNCPPNITVQQQGEQYVTLTMNRSTRKRKYGNNHNRSTRRPVDRTSGMRSTCSSLSNKSVATSGLPDWLPPDSVQLPEKFTFTHRHHTAETPSEQIPFLSLFPFQRSAEKSVADRYRLQSGFGNSRFKAVDELRNNASSASLPRTRLDNLKLMEKLGEGSCGEIYKCEMRFGETDLDSAVSNSSSSNNGSGESGNSSLSHTEADSAHSSTRLCVTRLLRSALTGSFRTDRRSDLAELDEEIGLLSRIRDDNLLRLTHVIALDDSNFDSRVGVVLELSSNTTLFDFFRTFGNGNRNGNASGTWPRRSQLPFTVYAAMQVASGMKHLEALGIAHRDLAARNCFIDEHYVVKVGDLAIANKAFDSHYYSMELADAHARTRAPLRWMSWEALLRGRFSSRADVWSFAVTLWELLTNCCQLPYSEWTDELVVENLQALRVCERDSDARQTVVGSGSEEVRSADEAGRFKRLVCPANCPREMYDLMCECWNRDDSGRPSFREIHLFLQRKCIGYDPKDDSFISFSKLSS